MNQNSIVVRREARRDMVRYFAWLEAEAGTDTAERFMAAADQTFVKFAASPNMAPKLRTSSPALSAMCKWRVDGFDTMLVFFIARDEGILVSRVLHAASDWWTACDLDKNTP